MSFHAAQKYIPDFTVFSEVTFDSLRSRPICLGLEYWQAARGLRRFPARDDIKPRDICGALQHMSLVKVEDNDFLYRIVGDAIVRAYDIPLQNRHLSDIAFDEPGFDAIVVPLFRKVVETGEPIAIRGTTGHDVTRANFTDYENILLPLGPNDQTVDHIMTFSTYGSRPFVPPRS